ncbi:MAG: hypothetical protein ACP5RI_03350 [Candidatus Micrarchaeia archaeon]
MDFYDIISDFNVEEKLEKDLGFKKFLVLGKDIQYSEKFKKDVDIGISSDVKELKQFVHHGVPAIVIKGSYINKMLLSMMKDNNTIIYLPISDITSVYGIERTKRIYYMKKLFEYARSKDINIGFASFATDSFNLLSVIQLIELAKVIGADERYAKYSISSISNIFSGRNER